MQLQHPFQILIWKVHLAEATKKLVKLIANMLNLPVFKCALLRRPETKEPKLKCSGFNEWNFAFCRVKWLFNGKLKGKYLRSFQALLVLFADIFNFVLQKISLIQWSM